MQGQSSPVQVKDPYTGSILMHVGSSCKTHRSVQCTPPKNNQNLIDGSNKKTKQNKTLASCDRGPGFDPRRRRGKFVGPNLLPFVSFAGMT